jgi:O-acetyl-ADP-ribose deacetylase (regulator of RNase III)
MDLQKRIRLVQGDITAQPVDAIVNAANSSLLGGGGVDGAIHRAAGPALLEECRKIGGCPAGEVRMTPGFRLPARFVFHTVGPVWRGGSRGEAETLASCYRNCLELAGRMKLETIAFPSISTGAYGFPLRPACLIALGEAAGFLERNKKPAAVVFVLFSRGDLETYSIEIDGLFAMQSGV